ncbi:MAG: hypothetical protein AB7F35_29855, partial [Acetobacteraceae bacterium]
DPAPPAKPPPLKIVCCDVLRLPRMVSINRPTFVFARRIELAGETAMSVDRISAPDLPLTIVTQELVCGTAHGDSGLGSSSPSIDYTTVSGTDGATVVDGVIAIPAPGPRGPRAAYAFQLDANGRIARVRTSIAAADLLAHGSPLALALGVQFQVATLLFTEDQELARALLSWVAELAGGSDDFAGLAAEARALLGRLDAMAGLGAGAMLVPRLDHTLYAQNARAMVATLAERWAAVTTIRTAAEDDQRWIDAVNATVAEKSSETNLAISLEKEAETAQSSVAAARMIAARDVREDSEKLDALRIQFELGIKRWKDAETLKEALNIAWSVVEIAMELPAIVVAGPEILALPAAKTAKGLFEGLVDIGKSASQYLTPARAIPSDGSGGRLRLEDRPNGQPSATRPILLDDDDDDDDRIDGSDDDDRLIEDDSYDDDRVVRVSRRGRRDSDSENDFLGLGSFAESDSTDIDSDDFWTVDLDATPKKARESIVLRGLAADPEKDFVLVNPNKKAQDFADIYNLQVKARRQQEKQRKANDARLEKIQKDLFSAGKTIAKSAKGIFDAAMRINQIAKTAESLEADSRKTLARVELVTENSFGSIEPRGIDVVTGGAQAWDDLEAEINRAFTDMGELASKIAGADDFRYAILRLVRRGRTMSEARLALARANADLAAARLRRRAADNVAAIYNNRLSKLADAAKRRQAMEQLAFGRVLEAKRAAWTAMEAYDRAAYYYELMPPGHDEGAPAITAPVDVFITRARKMGEGWITSERLARPPQPFMVTHVPAKAQLAAQIAQANGIISFDLSPDDAAFRGFYRCRLDELEIRLIGFERSNPVMVDIQTSGTYQDRLPDRSVARFVSDPYKIAYAFEPATSKVITPARIIPRIAEDFFKPTPFTTWQLSFRDAASDLPIRLEGTTSVEVVFKGEWCRV